MLTLFEFQVSVHAIGISASHLKAILVLSTDFLSKGLDVMVG